MYIPAQFEQPDIEVMHELIRNRPLATLVTLGANGIDANHIPLHLAATPEPFGVLRGHIARANPLWRDMASDVETLAIFHGPDAYISPSWYATKQEVGKVVPTKFDYKVRFKLKLNDHSIDIAQIVSSSSRQGLPGSRAQGCELLRSV